MKVGRITIGDFKSADDMEALISSHRAAVSTVLSTCETTILVKTSAQSFLNLTVYPSEAAADATLEKRGAWFKTVKHLFEDTFYYEGEISTQMTGKGENLLINDLEKDALKVQVTQLSQEVGQLKEMMKVMLEKCHLEEFVGASEGAKKP